MTPFFTGFVDELTKVAGFAEDLERDRKTFSPTYARNEGWKRLQRDQVGGSFAPAVGAAARTARAVINPISGAAEKMTGKRPIPEIPKASPAPKPQGPTADQRAQWDKMDRAARPAPAGSPAKPARRARGGSDSVGRYYL